MKLEIGQKYNLQSKGLSKGASGRYLRKFFNNQIRRMIYVFSGPKVGQYFTVTKDSVILSQGKNPGKMKSRFPGKTKTSFRAKRAGGL